MTEAKAKTYSNIFSGVADSRSIPWILGPISLIPVVGAALTVATSIVDGVYRLTSDATVTPGQLKVLMAGGGSFVKTWMLEKDAKHGELLVTMIFYNITVGTEKRLHYIYSSLFAIKIKN